VAETALNHPRPRARTPAPGRDGPDVGEATVVRLGARRPAPQRRSSPTPQAPKRALVVEPDDADFETLRSRLRGSEPPLAVERAHTVESALRLLADGDIEVCISELELPGRDGLELLRSAAARDWTVPIIVHTAGGSAARDIEAMELGASDYVEKQATDDGRLARSIRYALARRSAAERLGRLAQLDPLTGLANRALFQDRLDHALAAARRHQRSAAVMVLDLNGFKPVNDRLGHAGGDALLRLMAERLRARLRESDTVARLGGDEFAVVLEHLSRPEHAGLVARKVLDAIAPPAVVEGESVTVTASLGVAVFPRDADSGEVLLRQADAAMYRAKAEGGHRVRFHNGDTDGRVRRGALLAADLRRALQAGELVLHYQPQVTLGPGPLGLAAVPRWQHPDIGLVDAERFLSLAEDVGALEPLSEWVIGAACDQAARWRQAGLDRLHVALPVLSRRQLLWSGLVPRLRAALATAAIDPSAIELEIDEALLLGDLDTGAATLAALREVGVRLSLARFGEIRATFDALAAPGLHTLKLGRRLVGRVPEDPRAGAFLRAVIAAARQLELRVVAEGGKGPEQIAFLRRAGCDAIQGAVIGPPLPAEACLRWIVQAAQR
jgi:diguanylate cyclase (GGDEF)-like protein